MTAIYEALRRVFAEPGLEVQEHADAGWLVTDGFGDNGSWLLVGQAHADREVAVVYAVIPAKVPDAHRVNVALLLTHVNSGLVLGNFEMDLSDGEIRFKSAGFVGGEPDPAVVEALVLVAHSVTDHYLPAISAVARGEELEATVAGLDAR